MIEHGFLKASDYAGWSVCAGKPAMEAGQDRVVIQGNPSIREISAATAHRMATYGALGAPQFLPYANLDISLVTAEKGSQAVVDAILLAHLEGMPDSVIEVWSLQPLPAPTMKILALVAMLKYQLLHQFSAIRSVCVLPDSVEGEDTYTEEELYVFGAQVTEAAARALPLRGTVPEMSHLTVGPQCSTCLAANRCPALEEHVLGKDIA